MELTVDEIEENRIARKNAALYSVCQAINGSAAPLSIALGGLAGHYLLGADKSLATAPVTGFNIGVALAALPAAMLMKWIGRRAGFMSGAIVGIVGVLLAAYALTIGSFWLFCAALLCNGLAGAFVQQYRFAATDRGTPEFRAKAISWVLLGGVAAAIVGPQLILFFKDLLAPVPFAGAFLAGAFLISTSLIVMAFLSPSAPTTQAEKDLGTGRPLWEIITQPRFMVAVLCGTGSYAIMSFVMTAAPLAMVGCGHSVDSSTWGIQWHVMAMFAPSFFTGNLIARYGAERIVAIGLLILAACAVVALSGLELVHFWSALILLGLGWNFGFIGATTMITQTYRQEEKAKAQGANDFILFSSVALASFMSGQTLNNFGWDMLNWITFPIIGICLLSLLWLVKYKPALPA